MLFAALRRKELTSTTDADEAFAMALSYPSALIDKVSANLGGVRYQINIAKRLAEEEESTCISQIVRDKVAGLALGFLEAEPAESILELDPGQKHVLKRKFIRVLPDRLPEDAPVYEIELAVRPSSLNGGTVRFLGPTNQVIASHGELSNVDWTIEVRAENDFRDTDVYIDASLKIYASEDDFKQAKLIRPPDAIRVPISPVRVKKRPSHGFFDSALAVLKDLFGLIGGIPATLLASSGVYRLWKKRRKRATEQPQANSAPSEGNKSENKGSPR